jgi:nucleoporin NDC1
MSTNDRLNERPIYLRSVFLMLAMSQAIIDIYRDFGCLHLPVTPLPKTPNPDQPTHKIAPTAVKTQQALPEILQRCALTSFIVAALSPFPYALWLRHIFWSWHLGLAKILYNLPRSNARPVGYPPSNPNFMLRSFAACFLLTLTWETTSFLFSALLLQEPLKKDQPLSAASKDPNGTLITGLKAKRDVVKTFAFWELAIIARKLPERRKAIFADIDKEGGPAWGQMLSAALDVVQGINTRIEGATTPKPRPVDEPPSPDAMEIDSLPRIAPEPKNVPVFTDSPPPRTRTERLESAVEERLRRIGQSPNAWSPPVNKVKDLVEYATPAELYNDLSSQGLIRYGWNLLTKSTIGWFFRTTFERKVSSVILGGPYGNAAIVVDAIDTVVRMQVASLSEDIYGKVIGGVPTTVRTFTSTINAIEAFVESLEEQPTENSDIEEVEIILARLKAGLAELLSAFQLYLMDVGLSAAEHRSAQNASRPGRLLPERLPKKKEEKDKKKELPPQQNGQVRKSGNAEKTTEKAKGPKKTEEKGKERPNGEKRPQKRLEPQDPARKKLFQDTVPRNIGRREMEMVR